MERDSSEKRKAIHEVLTALDRDGRLTPTNVVEEARNASSPLHAHFTWDMEEAARKTWLYEARELISSFTIVVLKNQKSYSVQEFVEHPLKTGNIQGYTSITNIKSDRAMAREFLDRELSIASAYVNKTRDYAEILGLRKRVEDVAEQIELLRSDANGEQDAPAN